jgi:predicted phage tail protein
MGRYIYHWRWIQDGTVTQLQTVSENFVRISGATTSAKRKVYTRDNLPAGQYDIRTRFKTVPPWGTRYVNATYWEYFDEIVYDDFTYPGTALLALRALATDQLSGSLPKIDVLATRSTVLVWTGSAYEDRDASNPAWAAYDMLHDSVYGGGVAHSRIDYDAFSAWAEWCDAKGYKVHFYGDSILNLRKALDVIALNGRAVVVQMGNRFMALVDRPETLPVQRFLFTTGNIVKDAYTEEFLAMDDRADAVEVTYYDAELDYSRQTVEVQTAGYDASDREVRKSSVTLYGCTSRQQAANYGKFLLLCNRYLTLTATWDADVDALACLPGDVVEVAHDVPQIGYSGRVVTATGNTVQLDQPVTIASGKTYQVTVRHQDDDSRETLTVGNSPGTTDTLALTSSWTKIPAQYAVYSFGEVNRLTKLFRVLKITRSQDLRRRITAIEYVPEIYDDYAVISEVESPSDLTFRDLKAVETWEIGTDGTAQSVIHLSWRGTAIGGWNIFYKQSGGTWQNAGWTAIPSFILYGLAVGQTYTIAVSRSTPENGLTVTVTPVGKEVPPSDVTGFIVQQLGDSLRFLWNHVLDADLWGYEIRIGGTSWANATTIIDGIQENATTWTPPVSGTYTFRIKAVDQSGLYSSNEATATVTTSLSAGNIVLDTDELTKTPQADGTFQNMVLCPTDDVIALVSGLTDQDEPDWTDTTTAVTGYAGETFYAGSYETGVYDLGAVVDFTLRVDVATDSEIKIATDQTYPNRTDRTYPTDTDVSISATANYAIQYRTSQDGTTWTDYQILSGIVTCSARFFQIKVSCTVNSAATTFEISKIRHVADVPDVVVNLASQSIDAAGTTFTLLGLGVTILIQYLVGVTVIGTTALTPVVNKQADQFTVQLFNSAGVAAAGTADIQLRGY